MKILPIKPITLADDLARLPYLIRIKIEDKKRDNASTTSNRINNNSMGNN
jgi:hypothetical protein